MKIDELFEILLSEKPSILLKEKEQELFELIPELKVCKGFEQHNEWHVYDVYEHILHVVDYVPSNLSLRLAALFHDVGKPFTYTEDENKVGHFYGHWEVSKKVFDTFSKEHQLNSEFSHLVSCLIEYHDINLKKIDQEKRNQIVEELGKEGISSLYELKSADLLAQNEKYHFIINEYDEQKEELLRK